IALFLWALVRARHVQTLTSFALAGVALAWTAACHYYFLIYSGLIWLAVAIYDLSPYCVRFSIPSIASYSRSIFRYGSLTLAILFALISLTVKLSPTSYSLGPIIISLKTPENPLFIMWLFFMFWSAIFFQCHYARSNFVKNH